MKALQKFTILFIVLSLVASLSIGAVMAQDTAPTESTAFCTPPPREAGERPTELERPDDLPTREEIQAAVSMTKDEIKAYVDEGGDLATLFNQAGLNGDAIVAQIEARQAAREARQAERESALLNCIDEAVTAGVITADQANTLRTAIDNDTLRDLLQTGEFDGLLPAPRAERGQKSGEGRPQGRGGRN